MSHPGDANRYIEMGLIDVNSGQPEPGPNWQGFANLGPLTIETVRVLGYTAASVIIETIGHSVSPPAFDNAIIRFGEGMEPPIHDGVLDIFREAARTAINDRESVEQYARQH